jgi:hypothetical protein
VRTLAIGLWALQLVAAAIAFFACLVDVESIVGTGPALSIVGLLLALATRRLNSWSAVAFGLSGPLVCALGAALIAVGDWSPGEAQQPITILLGAYFLMVMPLAVVSRFAILRWQPVELGKRDHRWRYSMKMLLILMTAVCVVATVGRFVARNFIFGQLVGEGYAFMTFALAAALLSGAILWRFLARRRRAGEPIEPAGERQGL